MALYARGDIHIAQTERLTLTVEEACDRLGIGRTLGYELTRRGELPGVIRLGWRPSTMTLFLRGCWP